jgi:hypothetical protein
VLRGRQSNYATVYLAVLLRKYPHLPVRALRPLWLNRYMCEHGWRPADVRTSYAKTVKRARKLLEEA